MSGKVQKVCPILIETPDRRWTSSISRGRAGGCLMALEYPDVLQISQSEIERAQTPEVPVAIPGSSARHFLVAYTGTTLQALKGTSTQQWRRAKLFVHLPTGSRKWSKDAQRGSGWTLLVDGTATASPASFYNAARRTTRAGRSMPHGSTPLPKVSSTTNSWCSTASLLSGTLTGISTGSRTKRPRSVGSSNQAA